MIKFRYILLVMITAVLVSLFGYVPTATAKTWTCHATIALQGSSYSYAVPSWQMSGSATVDREKKCKQKVETDWLGCAVWQHLGIPQSEQNSYCQNGGTFRVDYGFDKRKKDWSFTKSVKPCCKCAGPLTFQ